MDPSRSDDLTLRAALGELSDVEAKQFKAELTRDPARRQEVEALQSIVASAKAAGATSTPERLIDRARAQALHSLGTRRNRFSRRNRRRGLVLAIAASLVAAAWIGARGTVAEVVHAAREIVLVHVLGNDFEALETHETEVRVVGNPLYFELIEPTRVVTIEKPNPTVLRVVATGTLSSQQNTVAPVLRTAVPMVQDASRGETKSKRHAE